MHIFYTENFMTMHLFIFCCIDYFLHRKLYDNASIYFLLYWFFFGRETTDFFLLVVCYNLLLCSKTILEHPHFYLRHCDSFVVNVDTVHPSKMPTTLFCWEEFHKYLIISVYAEFYIWFMIVVNLRNVYAVVMCDLRTPWEKCIQCSWPKKKLIFYIVSFLQITKKKGKEKPLLRRKSELPHDISMIRALESHKRSEEYLSTSAESQSANWDTKYMTLCHIEDHNATKKWRSISVPEYCKSIT